MLGLSTAVWLFFLAALLFGALIIVRLVFDLVGQTKELAREVNRASGRIKDARDELADLRGRTQEHMDSIQGSIAGGRRARRARKKGTGPERRTLR